MGGLIQVHAVQVHAVIATWDSQAFGACLLGLDLVLFGVLAAYWKGASRGRVRVGAALGRSKGGRGPSLRPGDRLGRHANVDDIAFRLAGLKPWPVSKPKAPRVGVATPVERDEAAAKRAPNEGNGPERDR